MGQGLRRMRKIELMELLLEQEKEIERLTAENEKLRKQVTVRKIRMEKAGSIAEAALQLSGIFEAAQRAANLYVNSVRPETKGGVEIEGRTERKPSDDTGN